MDKAIIVVFALIAIGGLIAIIYILMYNKLQKYTVRIKEAENEIGDTLKKRYELLIKMEQEINNSTELKQNNFKDFNPDMMDNFEIDRKLFKIMSTFEKIKDDYPDKLDTENFRNLTTEIKIVDEKTVSAKAYYNKYTTSLNMLIKKFPTNLIARIHRIEEREYFDNKNMNYKEILDFKL